MGRTKVNDQSVVTPDDQVTAAELKELADVPANHRLYDKQGQVYEDEDLVDTDEAEYGVIEPWERG